MAQTAVLRGTQELVPSRIQEIPGALWARVPARDSSRYIVLSTVLKGHKTPSSPPWGSGLVCPWLWHLPGAPCCQSLHQIVSLPDSQTSKVCYIYTPWQAPSSRGRTKRGMGACWQPQAAWLCRESYTCCLFVLAPEVSTIKHVRAVVGCCTPTLRAGVDAGKGGLPRRLAAGTRS